MILPGELKDFVDQILVDSMILDIHESNIFADIGHLFRHRGTILELVAVYPSHINLWNFIESLDSSCAS